jgi:glutamyl-tRNA synthetase
MTVRTRFAPSPPATCTSAAPARRCIQLGLCAPPRRHLHPAHRGHRHRALDAGLGDAILDGMGWLGLGPGKRARSTRCSAWRAMPRWRSSSSRAAMPTGATPARRSSTPCARPSARAGRKPRYDGRWRPENREGKVAAGRRVKPVLRFRNPDDGVVAWDDLVKGRIEIANAELDDLVLAARRRRADLQLRRGGRRLDMGITHVHPRRRPREQHAAADQHLPRAGAPLPPSAHVPMILGEDGEASRSATARCR